VLAWLTRHPRWTFHFTPTSASWLNAVENVFSKMTRQRIRRGVFHSIGDRQTAINAYLVEHNASPKPFLWTQSADAILAKLDRCPVPPLGFSALVRQFAGLILSRPPPGPRCARPEDRLCGRRTHSAIQLRNGQSAKSG
jgi:hypothetical protein